MLYYSIICRTISYSIKKKVVISKSLCSSTILLYKNYSSVVVDDVLASSFETIETQELLCVAKI